MKIAILTEDQATQDLAYPIAVNIWEAGSQLTPTSGTVTIKDPDGTAIVTAAAMTLSVKTLTYSLAAASTATLWENAIIEVDYIVSTVHYLATFLFDVVIYPLTCTVIDTDLKAYAPQIADDIWSTQTSYDTQIQEAFKLIKRAIKNKGKRPSLIIDGSQVRELIILKTFEMICFDFAKDPADIWFARYEKYKTAYEEAFASLNIKYDEDESGNITTEEVAALGQINLQR